MMLEINILIKNNRKQTKNNRTFVTYFLRMSRVVLKKEI